MRENVWKFRWVLQKGQGDGGKTRVHGIKSGQTYRQSPQSRGDRELICCYFWKGQGVTSLKGKEKILKAVFTSSLCRLCVSFLLKACDGRMLLSCYLQVCFCVTSGRGQGLSGDHVSPTRQSLVMRLDPWVCVRAQWCPTLCSPMDCSLPCSPVHGISQARILEWVSIASSRGSSWLRDHTCVSWIGRWVFTTGLCGKAPFNKLLLPF